MNEGSGPAAQRYEQDEAIERYGLIDAGIEWLAPHSGWKQRAIDRSAQWRDMLERAGRDYDVLVVAYVTRFTRNLNIGTTIREELHRSGATILFADERILLSDEADWEQWSGMLRAGEIEVRNLKRAMERTYRTKFRTHADPGGMPPLGFRRTGGTPSVLEVDPATIGAVVGAFRRYSLGNVSVDRLAADVGIHPEALKPILRNRIYNGWVQRYGEWIEAPWRSDPPVSDETFEQVAAIRASRTRGAAPRAKSRLDPLDGLLHCTCGARIWSDGYNGEGKHRKRHRNPCKAWGKAERLYSETWEPWIVAQIEQIDLSPDTVAKIAHALSAPPSLPDQVTPRRIARERMQVAAAFARGAVTVQEFVAKVGALEEQEAALERATRSADGYMRPDQAIAYLRTFADQWRRADAQARSDMVHATYERIDVAGRTFASVTLTPEAERHGMSIALPEQVSNARSIEQVAMVGGEGLEPPTSSV